MRSTKDAKPRSALHDLADQIAKQEETLRQGNPAGIERQRKLKRLPVRERLQKLLDPKAPFLELNLWAAYEMYPDAGDIPAAGVVTGVGCVSNHACMIIANDATVKAGAFFPATCKKVLRAQRIAMQCSLPIVYLVDSAGVYLPMQDEIFPDEDDFGRIFRNNAVISAMGIPQLAAIMGNCVAGGAYLPVLSDKILMTDGSELDLAGPALVKAAIGQEVHREELGGATMHSRVSGTIDFHEPDDESCLKRLRSLVDMLPEDPQHGPKTKSPDTDALYDLVGADGQKEYDARDLIRAIVDPGSFNEYKAEFGMSLTCGYARVGGYKVGIVASQHIRSKTAHGELQIGGVIYHDSADKAARFVMDCNQSSLPIVFFQDVVGFMVGKDSEQHGIIRAGAKLVNAVSNSTVPKITVIVGGSFGAGNYALCGKAFDPTFIFAWPGARYAVMGPAQAANTLAAIEARKAKLNDEEIADLHARVKRDYERQTDVRYAAARGWVDAIIAPHTTRDVLIQSLSVATRPRPSGGFRGGVMQV